MAEAACNASVLLSHSEILNPEVGDDHTQYLLLADRAGGQRLDLIDTGFGIRDAATPVGDVLFLETNAGVDFFNVAPDRLSYGIAGNRTLEVNIDPTGRGGIRYMPDGRTVTTAPTQTFMVQWDSLVVSSIPGGAPFGNDTAPAMIGATGEARFDDAGNLFSSALLFNQATIGTANGANVGPFYTMVNQPQTRTGTLGGSRSFSQANAVRSQHRVGPNVAGNVTLTSHEAFFAVISVDATVGTAAATTVNYFAAKAPTLTAGGTVGTLHCFDIPDIPAAGITTLRGINTEMNSGTVWRHIGTAPAIFSAANFRHDANNIGTSYGSGQNVLENWNGSAWELDPLVGDDFRVQMAAGVHTILSSGADPELRLVYNRMNLGSASAVGNQTRVYTSPARSTQVAGEWADDLHTAAGSLTIDDAMSAVYGLVYNSQSLTIGTGSITGPVATLNIGGMTTSSLDSATSTSAIRSTGRLTQRGMVHYEPISPANITADQTAWAGLLTGSQNNNGRYWARITANAGLNIRGIDSTAALDGDTYEITNVGANALTFTNQDAAAAAADRIILGGHSGTLGVDETILIRYDSATARWRVLFSN